MTNRLRYEDDEGNLAHHIILLKDARGQFFSPQWNFNNIPYWNLTQGYLVKSDADVEITWSGVPIMFNSDIPMNPSWNLIAYYPSFDLDASAPDFYVLAEIIDRVIIAKDVNGNFLNPEFHFSNMPPWRSTQGYWVKVNGDEPLIFRYPEQDEELASTNLGENQESVYHWNSKFNTGENMSVIVNSITDFQITKGARIIAQNSSGIIAGEDLVKDGQTGFAVWGDDPTTNVVDGLKPGESFTISLLEPGSNTRFPLEIDQILAGSGTVYKPDGFTVVELCPANLIPESYYLEQNFPNPFNSITSCRFGLPETANIRIQVFTVDGRQVTTLIDSNMPAGNQRIGWDASSSATGMYFIKMSAPGFETARKVTLLK